MDRLAQACEEVARHSGRLAKVAALAGYLRGLDNDEDLRRAVQFLIARPAARAPGIANLFETLEAPKLALGYATMREALLVACGWDEETVRLCFRETGDGGETIGLLMAGVTQGEPMTLERAEELYLRLHAVRRADQRVRILAEIFRTYRGLTLKYFIKTITGGFRIGLQEKMIEEAVAAAVGKSMAEIRAANNRLGDLAAVAVAARNDALGGIEAQLFHPMDFMLAKPLDDGEDPPANVRWYVEDKYDGVRSQVHVDHGRVSIYTRGMEESTKSYPEITAAFEGFRGSAILDGEVLAWQDGRALSFTVLQQRLARKRLSESILQSVPVVFLAYDALYADGTLLLDRPIEARREALAGIVTRAASDRVLLSPQAVLTGPDVIEGLFAAARSAGNEGLLLKRQGSLYEPGRRGGAWLKIKRAFATLDVVITAAEQGHGKRATVLSDYTFAVRDGDQFLNIGKAYTGLTDEEIRQLTRLLRESAVGRYGRVQLVEPRHVLEVGFDGIQRSPRHKSGFALRFPRILHWRRDKRPADCDTLDRVRELYQSTLNLTANRSRDDEADA
jgi:DNA ligase 1